MNIRAMKPDDISEVKDIHNSFYRNEFIFPDFLNKFFCSFVVTDDANRIISAGGVRPIAESIIVTDKDISVRKRRLALIQALAASKFITKDANFDRLHAVVKDKNWKSHLESVNFYSRGNILVLDL